jgi:dTDP-4-dehydrorhamnose reductase
MTAVKILLFGKNGQVGWELQRSLALLGDVVALGTGGELGLPANFLLPDQLAETVRTVRPDVIVNAAAYTAVDKAEADRDAAQRVNTQAPAVLALAAEACGALLVHYSTDYVFDGSGSKPWAEDDATGPINVYGVTKLEGEKQVIRHCTRHLIVRTSWVYGARGGNFAKTMLRLAGERDRLTVVDDQVGAPTGADLLADATAHMVRAALQDASLFGLYHAAAAGEASWNDYARFVLQRASQSGLALKAGPDQVERVPSSTFKTAAKRPSNSRLETAKLRTVFGLHLPHWQAGVDRMLQEFIGEQGKSA